jgi:two-component system KDP operon response regulator KdpE
VRSGPVALVIDDDAGQRRLLRYALTSSGYRVVEADSGEEGVSAAAANVPDVVLLDLELGDVDGLAVLDRLRAWTSVPVLVVSARDGERDKVTALDAGADDFVAKPFGIAELLARIRVALKHGLRRDVAEDVVQDRDLRIDLARRVVRVRGAEVHLTPNEYQLLAALARHADRVVAQRQLLTAVWGPERDYDGSHLRVLVAQLRRKIENDPARPRHLVTVNGVGYRLRVGAPATRRPARNPKFRRSR